MASADGTSPSSDRRGGLRRLLPLRKDFISPKPAAERNPLIIPSSRSPPPASPPAPSVGKKKGFAAAAFRGLGCASAASSQALVPAAAAVVRSSADWQGKRPRRRRAKQKKERRGQAGGGDVWCAPGIPFAADASVDCVVSHHQMIGRGRANGERIHRERAFVSRRDNNHEQMSSFMDSPSNLESRFFGSELLPSGHLRHLRGYYRSPGGIEEIMMFQTRVLLGGMDVYDQYQDWRLDVDNMSYEELLELSDRIGYVSTGLREDEITRSLRKVKHSIFDAPAIHFSSETEWKCSICQEEYEANDEMGKLECGHSYHICCIKQWLSQKNACPVCKTAVPKA
ncbi:pre-mRNA-splicing ATP-dependent RNA helicase prp28 [Cocos nucifera]|uniref:RING-type E3 ubiquitin transferase n=1 Tax=Cocos nucifera TaxID=13894 RepID=A0A8K0N2Z3_COCNU|nr:pre-mRNA-splicing ATP-dependent RNA helicase prp28 [Cocos nucifera]